jgi:hypothetical protein
MSVIEIAAAHVTRTAWRCIARPLKEAIPKGTFLSGPRTQVARGCGCRSFPHARCAMPFSARSLMKSVSRATNASSIFRLNGGFVNCWRLRTNTLH